MRTNVNTHTSVFTHEGGPSTNVDPFKRLKRLTMACMLWEDTFYIDGKTISEQIEEICKSIPTKKILEVALETKKKGLLRHIPLFLIIQAFKKREKNKEIKEVIYEVCDRPDQMTELLSLYWKDGKKPLPAQLKKGLAKAFARFDEYQLAKYNRDNPIKLKDVLFLCHAKPKDDEQASLWKRLVNNEMKTPDTWEVRLSSGANKKESFKELLEKGKMGKLAIIRNLRNMFESQVPKELVESELMKKEKPLLPFQFLAAAKHCMAWEDMIDKSMVSSMEGKEKLKGNTILLVDVSASMDASISNKSEMRRVEAACGVAILLREVCENISIGTFSNALVIIPPRHGMALRDAIVTSQSHGGTYLGQALSAIKYNPKVDRVIVITDEQTADRIPKIPVEKCYVLNVGVYQNGMQNNGQWLTINGFSEHCIDYIQEVEKDEEV